MLRYLKPKTKRVSSLLLVAIGACLLFVVLGRGSSSAADETIPDRPLVKLFDSPAPSSPVPFLQQPGMQAAGYDTQGARVASVTNGSSVLVFERAEPGLSAATSDQVCVIATEARTPRAGAGGCALVDDFARAGIFATIGDQASSEVIGLVPDGVSSILVSDGNGNSRTIKVANNAVRFPHAGATAVQFTVAGAVVEQEVVAPYTER